MFRILVMSAVALGIPLSATTLQKLSLDDMIQKSTAIVHAQVVSSAPAKHGSVIFTQYHLQVSEVLKASSSPISDIFVPGGTLGGAREVYAGAPVLSPKSDYVLFVWTSRSGLSQIIGLSQGLLTVTKDS